MRLAGSLLCLALSCALGTGAAARVNEIPVGRADSVATPAGGGRSDQARRRVLLPNPAGLWPPRLDPRDGRLHWSAGADSERYVPEPQLLHDLRVSRSPQDSISAWLTAGQADSLLEPLALTEVARISLAASDSARADSALGAAAARPSLWQWRALRERVRLVLARNDPVRAESLLAAASLPTWRGADRVAWLEQCIGLRLQRGDTTGVIELSLQAIRAFPSSSPPVRVLKQLDEVLAARGQKLGWDDEERAARVLELVDPMGASLRLERTFLLARAAEPRVAWRLALNRARVFSRTGRYDLARAALAQGDSVAPDSQATAQLLLERARVETGAGAWPEARRYFAAAAAGPDRGTRQSALSQCAQALEARGAWTEAFEEYQVLGRSTGSYPFEAGLAAIAAGEPDTALAWFARDGDDRARFWQAVLLRPSRRAEADSMLGAIARLPRYGFYQVAARETLDIRGWPGTGAMRSMDSSGMVRLVRLLLLIGRDVEAKAVVGSPWFWGDLVAGLMHLPHPPGLAGEVLGVAALAYASGWIPAALGVASGSLDVPSPSTDSLEWTLIPWFYPPPVFADAFAALPDSVPDPGIDRPLVHAVAWRESRFDPRARSRSNALGLLQLKLGTAADEARRLRERVPRDADDLFDPARNVRYGSAYLERLLARFGSVHRALAAYNAGPAALTRWLARWDRAPGRALGGAALECELTCRPETVNYVKDILAARQAYRELRPTTAP